MRRCLLLVGVALLAIDLRPAVVAVSPVLDEVQADLGLTTTGAALLGTAPVACFAVAAALAPALIRRLGAERAAWVSMALVAAGQGLRALAPESVTFLLTSVVALAGLGLGNVVVPALVRSYFPDRVGAVSSMYVVLLCLGTALPAQTAVPLADAAGWRVSVASWLLPAALAVVPWVVQARAVRQVPDDGDTHADADDVPDDVASGTGEHVPVLRLLRSSLAWGMALTLGMTSLGTYSVIGWLPQVLADSGVDRGTAGTMLAWYAVLGVPLSLGVPVLAVRVRNPYPVVLASAVLYLAGYLGLATRPAQGTWVWISLLGLAPLCFPLVLTLLSHRSRTPAGAAGLAGFVQAVGYACAGIGPLLVGLLHDATDGWTVPLLALCVFVVPMAVAGVWGCRPVLVEDTLPPTAPPARPLP